MILREPVALTFILISVLIAWVGGATFSMFKSDYQKTCHWKNERLLSEMKEGPIQHCWGDTDAP